MAGAARKSTVDMAVLAVVIENPGHRYDIGVRVVSRYEGLYRTTIQSVYRNVDRLKRRGMVEKIDIEADDELLDRRWQAPTKAYRATATGVSSLRSWMASPMSPSVARRELFTRLRALEAVWPNDYRRMLLLLDRYQEAVLRSIGFAGRGPAVTIVDKLAREDHEATIEGQLRWCDAAREELLDRIARELTR